MNVGDANRRLGRAREAAVAYRGASALAETELAQNPRQLSTRAYLAWIFANLGDSSRAVFEISQALTMAPENTRVMRHAVLTYEALKLREKSLELLRSAPAHVLADLSRQPDLRDLQRDARFLELLAQKPVQ
jgi:tetratricopeptide (TPR) repeat protein